MKRILFFALVMLFVLSLTVVTRAQDDDAVPYTIKLDPVADINPVKTQHTMIATVLDKKDRPLSGQRVEWILARHPKGVGDIVEHDDMGAIVGGNQKVKKIDNHYTVSYTNERPVVLTMGSPTKSDDIKLGVGQTWLTITSPVEGETHIIAFCPAIRQAARHKAFAIKYWVDAKIDWPQDAVNKVGTPHTFKFKLTKASTNAPLPGYRVKWTLVDKPDSPPAYLGESKDNKVIESETNELGEASVTLRQQKNQEGINQINVELHKPSGELLAIRKVYKKWISPKITIEKTGPDEGILQELVKYTIKLSNPGAAAANDVVITDTLPEAFSYEECSLPPSQVKGKVLTWNIGVLPKDAVREFTLTVRALKVGTWKNTVRVVSREAAPQTGMAVTEIGAPELSIEKTGPKVLRKGQVANYAIVVKNRGSAVARNVFVRDFIPAGMKFRKITKGTTLRWNIGELLPGKTFKVNYSLETIQVGSFVNRALIYMKTKKGPVHKTTWKTRVVAPELSVEKKGSSLVFLNKPATYTIHIKNSGTGSAKDVVVVDTLPKHLAYLSSTPRGRFKPARGQKLATITWKLGDIPAGKEKVLTLKTRANLTGRCVNSVVVRSETTLPPKVPTLDAKRETNIIGVPAMHINSYDTEDPVEVGKQTIYVIEARNEGTSPCTNITMVNHVDEEMEFISATAAVPFKVKGSKIFFDPVPILKPGDKLTYRIVCKAVKEGSAKNTATLRYQEFKKPILDEEGTSVFK